MNDEELVNMTNQLINEVVEKSLTIIDALVYSFVSGNNISFRSEKKKEIILRYIILLLKKTGELKEFCESDENLLQSMDLVQSIIFSIIDVSSKGMKYLDGNNDIAVKNSWIFYSNNTCSLS